jgi:hypothetical protein
MSQRINDAFNYAQQCYSTSSFEMFDCDKFVVKNLAATITKNDSGCPFQGSICRSNNTNLSLDTGYIDSNDNLGLNAPKDQRFLWRYKLQCAPLVTERYTSQITTDNMTMVRYNYGGLRSSTTTYNYSYEIEDLDSQYYMLGRVVDALPEWNYMLRRVVKSSIALFGILHFHCV